MGVNAQINACLPVPAKHSQPRNLSLLPFPTASARQGPRPGQVFSYTNMPNKPIPVLGIPESFMEFPGSLIL